jgi:hypothetical protein
MDNVQKLNDSDCHTPSSDPFRFNEITSYLEFLTMDKFQKPSYSDGN